MYTRERLFRKMDEFTRLIILHKALMKKIVFMKIVTYLNS